MKNRKESLHINVFGIDLVPSFSYHPPSAQHRDIAHTRSGSKTGEAKQGPKGTRDKDHIVYISWTHPSSQPSTRISPFFCSPSLTSPKSVSGKRRKRKQCARIPRLSVSVKKLQLHSCRVSEVNLGRELLRRKQPKQQSTD